jgi:hypothetical protein
LITVEAAILAVSHGKVAQLLGIKIIRPSAYGIPTPSDRIRPSAYGIPTPSDRVVTKKFNVLVSKRLLITVEAAILSVSHGRVAQLCGDHSAPACAIPISSARVVTKQFILLVS